MALPCSEQDMEMKHQEHLQELDSLRQKSSIDKKSLEHDARLKKQAAEVSSLVEKCNFLGVSDGGGACDRGVVGMSYIYLGKAY